MTRPRVGFVGLSHLGINSLAAAAERGFLTLGFDADPQLVASLSLEKVHINEPSLNEMLHKNKSAIQFSSALEDLSSCNVIYISLDIQTNSDGHSDLTHVSELIEAVLKVITPDQVLVVLCQVPPGFTRKIFRRHPNTYYQVETLIFGNAIHRALLPERIILGCATPDSIPLSLSVFLDAFDCPVVEMGLESAELSKTAINLLLAANVSISNTLAEVCENIGADWSEIIPALRLDRRIGEFAYIEAGLGLSGGNIERDLRTVRGLATQHSADPSVIDSFIENSAYRKKWLKKQFDAIQFDTPQTCIGLLGLSYKKDTDSLKNSPSIEFLNSLVNVKVQAYDPAVKSLPNFEQVEICHNAYAAGKGVDSLFIATAWDEFREIEVNHLVQSMKGRTIVDPFRMLAGAQGSVDDYRTLGKG